MDNLVDHADDEELVVRGYDENSLRFTLEIDGEPKLEFMGCLPPSNVKLFGLSRDQVEGGSRYSSFLLNILHCTYSFFCCHCQ